MMWVYVCDPTKNVTCKKTGCRTNCFLTTNERYRAHGFRPVTDTEGMDLNTIADLVKFAEVKE